MRVTEDVEQECEPTQNVQEPSARQGACAPSLEAARVRAWQAGGRAAAPLLLDVVAQRALELALELVALRVDGRRVGGRVQLH
jgi:hypothetical protein